MPRRPAAGLPLKRIAISSSLLALGLQLLSVTALLIWGPEISPHGGSAPVWAALMYWLPQIPPQGLLDWLSVPLPDPNSIAQLLVIRSIVDVLFWTPVFFVAWVVVASIRRALTSAWGQRGV